MCQKVRLSAGILSGCLACFREQNNDMGRWWHSEGEKVLGFCEIADKS